MHPSFQEKKATQAAALFLRLRGGPMSHMKLIKLLYILDREALLKWGAPVTYDRYLSMNQGPVLSATLRRINSEMDPADCSYWHKHISERRGHDVRLLADPGRDYLSDAEVALADDVFARYGRMDRWSLVDLTHAFPEWTNPNGSSIPIPYRSILAQGDYSNEDIELIEEELEAVALADTLLAGEG